MADKIIARGRAVFVDDEPLILEGLKNSLRSQRKSWDMDFCLSGEEALSCFDSGPSVDVIVTDMRMPKMDGAELLQRVKAKRPDVIRVVLSGHAELAATVRSVPIAHQYLAKPCEANALRQMLVRASELRALLTDPRLRAIVGEMGGLPSVPSLYAEVSRILADPDGSLHDAGRVISKDIAMSAKILQLVNSAFFGLPQKVSKLQDAVVYLGADMLRMLILSVEAFYAFGGSTSRDLLDGLQRHSILTARIAAEILPRGSPGAEYAFLSGMLHEIGVLLFLQCRRVEYGRCLERAAKTGVSLHRIEVEVMGASHAELGGYLLGIWGLPHDVVEAVVRHECPWKFPHEEFGLSDAVYVASRLAQEMAPGPQVFPNDTESPPEEYSAFLERVGRMSEWRKIAEAQARLPI